MKSNWIKYVFVIIIIILLAFAIYIIKNDEQEKKQEQEYTANTQEEKVKEMDIKCSDEAQLQVANNLVETAKSNLSYCGSKNNVDTDSCGALKKYFYFDENVKKAEATIELITTEQHDGKGYVWVKYSANYYDANNDLVMGMGETYSRWDIEEKDGTWVVIAIDEMA